MKNIKSTKNKDFPMSVLKVRELLLDLITSTEFRNDIKILRKKYNIPDYGYEILSEDRENISKYIIDLCIPKRYIKLYSQKELQEIVENINIDLKKMYKGFDKNSLLYGMRTISFFLFFNKISLSLYVDPPSLIEPVDIDMDIKIATFNDDYSKYKEKPVAILLHPETTRRDLEDFIKKRFNVIENLLSEYKSKEKTPLRNLKIKKISARKRDIIISDNREKDIKEIRRKLADNKIYLEDGNIYNYKKKIIKTKKV